MISVRAYRFEDIGTRMRFFTGMGRLEASFVSGTRVGEGSLLQVEWNAGAA